MSPPKKDRVWLRKCIAEAAANGEENRSAAPHSRGGRRPSRATESTPDRFLSRRRLRQGAPYKTPMIREALWDFFVDIRRSVASTVSPKLLLLKAREIAETVLRCQRLSGHYSPLPVIDRNWLHRWKRDKGVVWRRPNCRYKCSRSKLMARLRAMYINNFKIRRLAWHFLGHEMSRVCNGVDEKPLHFNEAGSKNVRTLEVVGAPAVRLKQNHAASRERASVMTWVSSDESVDDLASRLPVFLECDGDIGVCTSFQEAPLNSGERSTFAHKLAATKLPRPENMIHSSQRLLFVCGGCPFCLQKDW